MSDTPDSPPRPKKQKRLQKYRREWEEANSWLESVSGNKYKGNCKTCRRVFSVAHGGLADVRQHAGGYQHGRNMRTDWNQTAVSPISIPVTTPEVDSGQRPQAPVVTGGLVGMLPHVMTTQVTDAIASFIITDLHPPALVEGEGFKQLLHTLLPSYKEPPSASLLESLLKENHTKGKKRLVQLLRTKAESEEDEDISDYTAPIEFEPRRRGRSHSSWREGLYFVTLSVDIWFHKWQGGTERYVTLWAHYIDTNFTFHNLALTTQRVAETGAGDHGLRAVEAQVKVMAQEWGIFQPNLVMLGGEGREKMRLEVMGSEKSGETASSGPYPNSTTFLEREDSVSSDELHGLEHAHYSSEGLPSIPCFLSAVQGCIEEVMSHPVISKTLSLFQGVLSNMFTPNRSQYHMQSLLQTIPKQEQAQLKTWAHSRPSWNKLYDLLITLVKHQNLFCDIVREVKTENLEDTSNPTVSESRSAVNSYTNTTTNTSPAGTTAPQRSDWKVIEDLCLVLKPLDVACRTLTKEAFPRLSLVKPILTGLLSRHLKPRSGDSSAILKEVKRMMRQNLASCYDNPFVNRALCVACSLDPQFHGLGFMEMKEQIATFEWLKKEAVRIVKEDKRCSQIKRQSHGKRSPSPLSPESESDFLRRSKRLKDIPPINFRELVNVKDEESDAGEADENELGSPGSPAGLSGMEFLLGDLFCSAPQGRQSSVEESVDMEMSAFRADKGASLGVEPLQWWRTKAVQFPLLATVARAYLAAPAVAGSAAQDFVQEEGGASYRKRANIPPESLDAILFLHHNHTDIGQTAFRNDQALKEDLRASLTDV